jgi:hypothetical protein
MLAECPGNSFDFVLSPWPSRTNELVVEGETRPLPNMVEYRMSSRSETGWRFKTARPFAPPDAGVTHKTERVLNLPNPVHEDTSCSRSAR